MREDVQPRLFADAVADLDFELAEKQARLAFGAQSASESFQAYFGIRSTRRTTTGAPVANTLRAVRCPRCGQEAEITPRSTAWCSNKHAPTRMLPKAVRRGA